MSPRACTYICCVGLPYGSAMCFQLEELASCSNSIDAAALGYSHLLRCEGEIRLIQILPFLLASSDKLSLLCLLRRGYLEQLLYGIGGPWSRGRHQLVDSSDKEAPEPFSLYRCSITLATLYDRRWILASWPCGRPRPSQSLNTCMRTYE